MGSFHSDDRFIYLDDDYMEFYIPKAYFDDSKTEERRIAVDYSDYIDTLGIFYCGLFDKNKKFKEFKILNQPYPIKVYAHRSEERLVNIAGEQEPVMCKVLSFIKNDKVMDSLLVQDSVNALHFMNMLIEGKLPKIPYDKLPSVWRKNQVMNKVNFGIRTELEEVIISLNYRNPNDLSQSFSIPYGSNLSVSPYDYKTINSRQICQYSSTYASLTFEDIDSMLTTSINRSRDKGTEHYSPIEDVIKM